MNTQLHDGHLLPAMNSDQDRQRAIAKLKAQARPLLAQYTQLASAYDCGSSLMFHINPRTHTLAAAIDEILDQLAEIDEDCPSKRYSRHET
jgi:hypothetical protein